MKHARGKWVTFKTRILRWLLAFFKVAPARWKTITARAIHMEKAGKKI